MSEQGLQMKIFGRTKILRPEYGFLIPLRVKEPLDGEEDQLEIDLPVRFYCFIVGPESYKNQVRKFCSPIG